MTEITAKEYAEIFAKQKLNVVESFTDPDGGLHFGYGCPAMDTFWGIGEQKILLCEMRKEYMDDPEWKVKYYKF